MALFVLVRFLNLKKRMDQLMYYFLVGVLRIDMFRRQHGWGMRVIKLLNWIILLLAFICANNFFFWFITSAKSMMGSRTTSRRARVNEFFNNNPWTENDTNFAVQLPNVKTAVKPIHVNQTQLMMGSGNRSVTAFIDNPWTENDTIVSVSTAVKPNHLIEHVNNNASGTANEQSIWFK